MTKQIEITNSEIKVTEHGLTHTAKIVKTVKPLDALGNGEWIVNIGGREGRWVAMFGNHGFIG